MYVDKVGRGTLYVCVYSFFSFLDRVLLRSLGWHETPYVVRFGLKLTEILLHQPPKCWDHKHVLSCLAMCPFLVPTHLWLLVLHIHDLCLPPHRCSDVSPSVCLSAVTPCEEQPQ